MSRAIIFMFVFGGLLAVGPVAQAIAQCPSYDFENLAVGTIVTNQYDGVTFSVVGQSCENSPTIYLKIANQFLGDPFGSKVILIDQGCPDFSSDYVRMVFDYAQDNVSFTLGPWYGTYAVRAYSTTSGGSPISTTTVTIPGSGFTACHRFVEITSATRNIRRIEIQETVGLWEAIDDLAFGMDDTPPTAQIDSPALLDCICGTVLVTGIACDPDGQYGGDRLEYLRVYPAAGSTWTLIDDATTPVCDPGNLYYWNTSGADVTEGLYMLRLTVTNACGLSTSAITTVYVDKDFDVVTIRQPLSGAILGGEVCLDGTAWDEFCFDHYTVDYRPTSGGAWQPVDPNQLAYGTEIVADPLATWHTQLGSPADGSYTVRVVGESHCGYNRTDTVSVIVDNTPPVARILQPAPCSEVQNVTFTGTASDAHIDAWRLDYYDSSAHAWQPIASGNAAVNGLLGTWHTASLDPCYYTVRLAVWDQAIVNNCGGADRHYSEDYVTLAVGNITCPGDVNRDGQVDFDDINPFVEQMGVICP